jgi:hypothetical protein
MHNFLVRGKVEVVFLGLEGPMVARRSLPKGEVSLFLRGISFHLNGKYAGTLEKMKI